MKFLFPPKKLLFFWLYFLFSLLFLSFVQTRLTPGAPTHFRSVGFQGKRKKKGFIFVVCVESSVTLWKSRSLTLFFLASFAWNTILYLFCSFLATLFFFLTRGINASQIDTNFFFFLLFALFHLSPSPPPPIVHPHQCHWSLPNLTLMQQINKKHTNKLPVFYPLSIVFYKANKGKREEKIKFF